MTHHPILTVVDDASSDTLAQLEAQLDAFNIATTRIDDARALSILLPRADGMLRAGLHGHTWGGSCEIKLLWIDAPERGRGLGSLLLRAAEAEARERGCRQIVLMTHSFQAPNFYARHGFETLAAVSDNPAGHTHILMRKQLLEAPITGDEDGNEP